MKHTSKFIANFSSSSTMSGKHEKIKAIHFDSSGHVVGTNSHVLFASKDPFQISKSNKSFSSEEVKKGNYIESSVAFQIGRKYFRRKVQEKFQSKYQNGSLT